jgi:hypothetical protein
LARRRRTPSRRGSLTARPTRSSIVNNSDAGVTITTPGSEGDRALIVNNSDAGVTITGITIQLKTGLFFDTANPTPGGGSSHQFATSDAATVGLQGTPILVADGATSLTLSFSGFDAGETFTFTIDVDKGDGNPGRNVPASQFEGSTITFTFAGPFGTFTTSALTFDHPFSGASPPGQFAGGNSPRVFPTRPRKSSPNRPAS